MRRMQSKIIQVTGLALTIAYAVLIVWIYATEPRTFKEVATGVEVAAGTYQVNQEKFNSALDLFRREQFRAARDEWQRADPAQGDARTQFYTPCNSVPAIRFSHPPSGLYRLASSRCLRTKAVPKSTARLRKSLGGSNEEN